MTFSSNYIRRAAFSLRCRQQLQSTFPQRNLRASDASPLSTASCTSHQRYRSCSKRQHSTAAVVAAADYSIEVEKICDDDNMFSSSQKIEECRTNEHMMPREHMPRLQALRERLRLEKKRGSGSSIELEPDLLQPSVLSLENTNVEESSKYSSQDITNQSSILTDMHGRHHNYLRISLSERCNLRCQYCMPPEGVPLTPSSKLLTDEEIMRLVDIFVKNGVNKIRLTGGEPLLRPNLVPLVRSISDTLSMSNNLSSDTNEGGLVGMTTNGISLSRHIDDLVDAGLTGVNISLDTLRADRFLEITRRNGLDKVMRAIGDCVRVFQAKYGNVRVGPAGTGGSRVKINCVVMKGFNDDELSDFIRMADEKFGGNVDMRFIEWMVRRP